MLYKLFWRGPVERLLRERTADDLRHSGFDASLFTLDRRVLLEKMRQAHIFAMPSTLESFGMVSLEAMSVGLPVVGLSQCLGTNEVVQHGRTGLLVDGEDLVDSLADALRRIRSSPAEREEFGRAGLEHARMYDQRRIGSIWNELLLESESESST